MTSAEYLQIIQSTFGFAGGSSEWAVTVLFAYLIATYYIGSKLTLFQAYTLSIVYSIYYTFPVLGSIQNFNRVHSLLSDFYAEYPEAAERYFPSLDGLPVFVAAMTTVYFLSWLLSIGFMVSQRRKSSPTQEQKD